MLLSKIFASKEQKYKSASEMIRNLGVIKNWWDLDKEYVIKEKKISGINGQKETQKSKVREYVFCAYSPPEMIEEFYKRVDVISREIPNPYKKGEYYIEIARFSISGYSDENQFKGCIELDKNILEIIREELPILKGYHIVFFSNSTTIWTDIDLMKGAQSYII